MAFLWPNSGRNLYPLEATYAIIYKGHYTDNLSHYFLDLLYSLYILRVNSAHCGFGHLNNEPTLQQDVLRSMYKGGDTRPPETN